MKNLLPEEKQQEHRRRYYGRLGVTVLAIVVGVEVIGLVALLPAFVTVQAQKRSTDSALLQVHEQLEAGGGTEARSILTTTSALTKLAATAEAHPQLADIVSLIKPHEFSGITVHGVSITMPSKTEVEAHVSGRAATRTSLVGYSSALESEPRIAEVNLPLRDLAASQNIPFTLSLTFLLED